MASVRPKTAPSRPTHAGLLSAAEVYPGTGATHEMTLRVVEMDGVSRGHRVPLYYNHGRLSKAAIQGLTERGVLVQAGVNQLVLTNFGREEAQRLLAADEVPGF